MIEDLMDEEGENRAVRAFLLYYGGGNAACPIISMRTHLARSGFDGCWPAWAAAPNSSTLTKAGAQLWIRHLFSLECDELAAEVERLRAEKEQAAQDSFALAWTQALSDVAFYVAGHCANGEHHAEIIVEMVAPKLTIGGSAPAAGTERDAELAKILDQPLYSTRQDAERFRRAIALEDSAEKLYAAVLNNAPDGVAIRREFDAAIGAHKAGKESA